MLLSMSNDFIPKGFLSKVVIIQHNNSKRKDYWANFRENNNENNLYYAIESVGIN